MEGADGERPREEPGSGPGSLLPAARAHQPPARAPPARRPAPTPRANVAETSPLWFYSEQKLSLDEEEGPFVIFLNNPDVLAVPSAHPHSAARPRAGTFQSETAVNKAGTEAIVLVLPHPLPRAVPEPLSVTDSAPPALNHPPL